MRGEGKTESSRAMAMGSMDVVTAKCTEHQVAADKPKLEMVPVFNEKSGVMTGLVRART